MTQQATLLIDAKLILGEGPVWHPSEHMLYCVDIRGKALCKVNLETDAIKKFEVPEQIGSAVPTTDGRFIIGLESGLAYLDLESGQTTFCADIEKDIPGNRFNDGKCDPQGIFWTGSMDNQEKETTGSLYSFDGKLVKKHLSNIDISNGLAWSADQKTMYYIDSPSLEIRAFDFDAEHLVLSNQRVVIKINEPQGFPDGMTIDLDDKLWVAHWGGSCIRRWDPITGEVLQEVSVPAPHTSSCAFGGKNYDTLFITTARKGLSEKQLEENPLSGGLFYFKPGVQGRPTDLFKAY